MTPRILALVLLTTTPIACAPKGTTTTTPEPEPVAAPTPSEVVEPSAADPSEVDETTSSPPDAKELGDVPGPVPVDATEADSFNAEPKKSPKIRTPPSLALGYVAPTAPRELGNLTVHYLDVGQGDSTLIECPDGKKILIDAGSGTGKSGKPKSARDYFRKRFEVPDEELGKEKGKLSVPIVIDALLVTHPDRDHYNSLAYMLKGAEVKSLFIVGSKKEYSGSFADWLKGYKGTTSWFTKPTHDVGPNPDITCGAAETYVLAAGVAGDTNTRSIVLAVVHGQMDFIFTGDATEATEKQIIAWHGSWIDAEVLKLGHHGSNTSTSQAWVDEVTPRVSIASSGVPHRLGHPRVRVVERVEDLPQTAQPGEPTPVPPKPHVFHWYDDSLKDNKKTKKDERWQEDPAYEKPVYGTGSSGHIRVVSNGENIWVFPSRR